MMDRASIEKHMHHAGNQWAVSAAMGDWAEVDRLRDEIDGYTRALDRLDYPDPWDTLKGSPDTSRLGFEVPTSFYEQPMTKAPKSLPADEQEYAEGTYGLSEDDHG